MLASTLGRPGRFARAVCVVLASGLLAGCGINTIPTLQERAKAAWSEVLNQYQRRADLIPNLVETVKGYAAQESKVLTDVVEARAQGDASHVSLRTSSPILKPSRSSKRHKATSPARSAGSLADHRELSGPEVEPELPCAAIATRRHREPHRDRAARLHHRGQGLQHRDPHHSRALVACNSLSGRRAHAELHRGRGDDQGARGQVLATDARAVWPRCRGASAGRRFFWRLPSGSRQPLPSLISPL